MVASLRRAEAQLAAPGSANDKSCRQGDAGDVAARSYCQEAVY